MRHTVIVLAVLSLVGCGPSLTGNWIFGDGANGDQSGFALDFVGADGYVLSVLQLTGPNTANTFDEAGTFTFTDTSITFTPVKTSCDGDPDPAYTVPYEWINGDLTITFGFGVVAFQPNTASVSSSTGGFIDNTGCFSDAGFTDEPLEPVQN
jgi:hypothetical protein